MLFDWFTVGAQALNFLILVWVLKHFLYKPILNAIDAREALIAKELADAASTQAEARHEHDEFQRKNQELDTQRAALLSTATDEANAERERLLTEAREAADAWSTKRRESMQHEARTLAQSIGHRTQVEVFAIARKALTDLAATSLEGRMVDAFTQRLRDMDDQAKSHMGEALKTASDPALVRSAFDLPEEQRAAVRKAVNETFSADVRLRFETAPDLVSGLDLSANGQRVGWNIGSYLTSLNTSVSDLLKAKEHAEAMRAPASDPSVDSKALTAVASTPRATIDPTPDDQDVPTSVAAADPAPATRAESTSDSPKLESTNP